MFAKLEFGVGQDEASLTWLISATNTHFHQIWRRQWLSHQLFNRQTKC